MKSIFSLVIDKPSYWSSIAIFNYLSSFLKHSGEKGRKKFLIKICDYMKQKNYEPHILPISQSLNGHVKHLVKDTNKHSLMYS